MGRGLHGMRVPVLLGGSEPGDVRAGRRSLTLGKSPLAKTISSDVFPQPPSPTMTALISVALISAAAASEGPGGGLCPPGACCMWARWAWPQGRRSGPHRPALTLRVPVPPWPLPVLLPRASTGGKVQGGGRHRMTQSSSWPSR